LCQIERLNEDQSDWNALGPRLSDIFKERADKVAFVRGDEEVPFAQVTRAIASCGESGSTT
jgi:biopolymer transport protein ExbD